jgi:hypothetical protein
LEAAEAFANDMEKKKLEEEGLRVKLEFLYSQNT